MIRFLDYNTSLTHPTPIFPNMRHMFLKVKTYCHDSGCAGHTEHIVLCPPANTGTLLGHNRGTPSPPQTLGRGTLRPVGSTCPAGQGQGLPSPGCTRRGREPTRRGWAAGGPGWLSWPWSAATSSSSLSGPRLAPLFTCHYMIRPLDTGGWHRAERRPLMAQWGRRRPREHWQPQQRPAGRTRGQERGPQGGKMGEREPDVGFGLKWNRNEENHINIKTRRHFGHQDKSGHF